MVNHPKISLEISRKQHVWKGTQMRQPQRERYDENVAGSVATNLGEVSEVSATREFIARIKAHFIATKHCLSEFLHNMEDLEKNKVNF